MTEEVTRDEFLFGTNLSDRIKDKITIEKSSQQINDPNQYLQASTPTGKLEWSASCIYTVEDDGSSRTTTSSSTIIQQKKPAQPSARRPQAHRPERSYQRARNTTSSEPPAYPGCRHLLRQAFQQRGLPENSLEVMLSSLAQATTPHVMSFLSQEFNSGACYATLNSNRSDLSLLIDSKIGTDMCIKRAILERLRTKRFHKGIGAYTQYEETGRQGSAVAEHSMDSGSTHYIRFDKFLIKCLLMGTVADSEPCTRVVGSCARSARIATTILLANPAVKQQCVEIWSLLASRSSSALGQVP
ncbi:hypothetical protein MSG28_007189 [Choristoneura fumiferana]|uniref:Uncharacterized protein n=1 Tax=Choristoneura fumiferana TaxID=7141 RepID=A0ACC0JMX5_CHOFU|nr:hypothetical protein MSG28_007189 [Choristoneura fumiferana]